MGWLQNLIVRIRGDSTHLDGTLKKTSSTISSWAGKIAGLMGIAFGVRALVNFGKEAVKLAAEAEGIKSAYASMGGDTQKVLEDMKTATRGVIEESDLMKLAVRAKNFNIPLQDLAKYLEFATNRAITTGKSVNELVELIVTGLGRKSSRSMIQLGLSAKTVQEAFNTTGGFMKLVTAELEKMGDVADTTNIKTGQIAATWKDIKEKFGDWINKSELLKGTLNAIYDVLNKINKVPESKFSGMTKEQLQNEKERLQNAKVTDSIYKNSLITKEAGFKGLKNLSKEARDTRTAIVETDIYLEKIQKDIDEINRLLAVVPPPGSTGEIITGEEIIKKIPVAQPGVTPYKPDTEAAKMAASLIGGIPKPGLQAPRQTAAEIEAQRAVNVMGELSDRFQESVDRWGDMIANAKEDLVFQLEDMVEGLFAAMTSGNWDDFGKQLLLGFANFLSMLGKLLISFAVAESGFLKASMNPASWPIALAAGIAALAAAGLIKGSIAKAGQSVASGGGSSGSASATSTAQNLKIIVEGKILGRDIYMSNKRTTEDLSRST